MERESERSSVERVVKVGKDEREREGEREVDGLEERERY
jgi:hypothetical protein